MSLKQKIPNPYKPVTLFFSRLIEREKAAQRRNDCKRKGGNTSIKREPVFSSLEITTGVFERNGGSSSRRSKAEKGRDSRWKDASVEWEVIEWMESVTTAFASSEHSERDVRCCLRVIVAVLLSCRFAGCGRRSATSNVIYRGGKRARYLHHRRRDSFIGTQRPENRIAWSFVPVIFWVKRRVIANLVTSVTNRVEIPSFEADIN